MTTHRGIPITTVARTLPDLAATVRADRLERAYAQALHLHLYDQRASDELLRRANGHRGTRALAHATARDAALQAAGIRAVRFAWRADDETILRRLRALLH
jgi:hypothetical protein